jgi:TRAP-type mannitol/chloroaromatic compound transport system permease small subunit
MTDLPASSSLPATLVRFIQRQNQLQQTIGHAFAWLALTLVLLSAFVVVYRYGFNSGSIALQETILYNHAIFFMMGMAYTLQQGGHVRVDVFYTRMSENRQAWVNLIGSLVLALPSMVFIFWVSWDYVTGSWAILEGSSEAGGLPFLYVLKSFILIMATLMALQILANAVEAYLKLFQRQQPAVIDWFQHREPEHEEKL